MFVFVAIPMAATGWSGIAPPENRLNQTGLILAVMRARETSSPARVPDILFIVSKQDKRQLAFFK